MHISATAEAQSVWCWLDSTVSTKRWKTRQINRAADSSSIHQ